jgi:hypothetical protein
MTIDERLEALTQSLELMAGLHRETEVSVGRLSDALAKIGENQAKLETSQAKTEKMLRGFGRFAMAIARDHEKRLFDLERPAT